MIRRLFAHRAALAFFLLLAAVGAWGVGDFGVAWDEWTQRTLGRMVWRYLFHADPAYQENFHRIYGPFFELLLVAAEKLAHVSKNLRAVFLLRHALTYAVFGGAVYAFYRACAARLGSARLGLVAALLLTVSPRIFGDAFYNSKDIPFMAAYAIATMTMIAFLRRPGVKMALWHALACGLAIDIRMLGIVLPALTLAGVGLELWRTRRPAGWARPFALYGAVTLIVVYLCWPYLWSDPIGHFVDAYRQMAQFPWGEPVLYLGQQIPAPELPWHYLPCWIGISVPPMYLLLFLVGLALLGGRLVTDLRQRQLTAETVDDSLVAASVLGPVVAVILVGATVYDGWRQLYFIYPGLLYVAMIGVHRLAQALPPLPAALAWRAWGQALHGARAVASALLLLALGLNVASVAIGMVRAHPHEQVYFNALAGDRTRIAERFELDYWGLSFRAGLEWVLAHDAADEVVVALNAHPGNVNALILSEADRARLQVVDDVTTAQYFISNYRYHREPYPYPELAAIVVDGVRILSIFRVPPAEP